MHSLRLPNLSLLSTKTKLLIHGVLHALEQVHLPVACCLSVVGTSLSSVQGLVSKVFAWVVYWDQPGCDNLVLGACQSLQRHLGTHTGSFHCLLSAWVPVSWQLVF